MKRLALAAAFVAGKSDTPLDQLETEAAGWEETAKSLSALDVEDEGVKNLATEYADVLNKAQASSVSFVTEETQVKAKVDALCR